MKTLTLQKHPDPRLPAMLVAITLLGSVVMNMRAAAPPNGPAANSPAYPLKVSNNGRYLVDQNNTPFLIVGDTPQGLMSRLSEAQADRYFADRQAHGFNTMGWIDVACAGHDYPANPEGNTPDGIRPFTGFVPGGTDYTHYDLTKPNEAYFTRLDHIVTLAAKHGILVFIDPIETIGWLATLRNNGLSCCFRLRSISRPPL